MVEQNYFDWVGNQRKRERVNRNNQWELFSQFGNGHVATDSKSGDDIIVTESAKRTGPWSSSGDIVETPDDSHGTAHTRGVNDAIWKPCWSSI